MIADRAPHFRLAISPLVHVNLLLIHTTPTLTTRRHLNYAVVKETGQATGFASIHLMRIAPSTLLFAPLGWLQIVLDRYCLV
jgi:hypothetical protein